MALTEFQRRICRLIAANRILPGESYVAGAVALNELIGAARVSRDIDLFHDTAQAVEASWEADRAVLESNGFAVVPARVRSGFVEARVQKGTHKALVFHGGAIRPHAASEVEAAERAVLGAERVCRCADGDRACDLPLTRRHANLARRRSCHAMRAGATDRAFVTPPSGRGRPPSSLPAWIQAHRRSWRHW